MVVEFDVLGKRARLLLVVESSRLLSLFGAIVESGRLGVDLFDLAFILVILVVIVFSSHLPLDKASAWAVLERTWRVGELVGTAVAGTSIGALCSAILGALAIGSL